MKTKVSLFCAAGALVVIASGCNSPELAKTPYSPAEQQWSEYIGTSYPEWKAPQTVPPNSDNMAPMVEPAPTLLNPESTLVLPPVPADKESKNKKVEAQTYTVQSGDTLSKIAHKFYGKSSKWNVILDANKNKITDAGKVKVGTTINIPAQ